MSDRYALTRDGYTTLGADWTSDAFWASRDESMAAIQCVYTGNPEGQFSVQISNDKSRWYRVRWFDLDGYRYDGYTLNGSPGHFMLEFQNLEAGWLKLRYVRTSGEGGLTYHYKAKFKERSI